jgi:putative ABC transport system substrate-binding protein
VRPTPPPSRQRRLAVARGPLRGANPADLSAVRASKFVPIINAQTTRTLGVAVPDKLLSIADEAIE